MNLQENISLPTGRRKVPSWKLEQYILLDPEHRPVYELAMGKEPRPEEGVKILPEQPVTPTELGKKLLKYMPTSKPLKGKQVNDLLIDLGLQRREYRDYNKRSFYVPTPLGEAYATIFQVNIPESSTEVTQVKWFPVRTIEFIKKAFNL